MNFEGLEDDLDIGYMPTIGTGSRAAGMKYGYLYVGK